MKTDEQIMEELERASRGLMMMSESDYPFEVIEWERDAHLNPDSLRRVAGAGAQATVATAGMDEFFRAAMTVREGQREEERLAAERYRKLFLALEMNLREIEVHRVGEVSIAVYILGRSPSGRWLGLSTRVVET